MQDNLKIKTGSLCPAISSAGLLGDKWTLLILRELFLGTTRFNDFQRALPRLSPTVLSKRLKMLEVNDLIVRKSGATGRTKEYRLTRSGRELGPIVEYMAVWGLRWRRRRIGEEDYDISGFMWDFHRTLNADALPDGNTVLYVKFKDHDSYSRWWVVARENTVDLCMDDPGLEVDVYLTSSLDCLISVWMGDATVKDALELGTMTIEGMPHLIRTAANWFPQSPLSKVRPVTSID
ncbi:winged helix-turn-helix transcriptional regulator [Sneathiella aquimaris]|uniref:winged helix-turn-helix transcriptional regulator n=1 Tax=Sneathiella aquimaris TaxID=2599305 RepID=UPI00146ABA43|nr:helix-turn-helix domain-containing protein [Sneathiella aquimaris]